MCVWHATDCGRVCELMANTGYAPVYPYGPAAPNIQFHNTNRERGINISWFGIMMFIVFIVGLIAVPWVLWGAQVGYSKTDTPAPTPAPTPDSNFGDIIPELYKWSNLPKSVLYKSYYADPASAGPVWYVGVAGSPAADTYANLPLAMIALATAQGAVGTQIPRLTIIVGAAYVPDTQITADIGDWSGYAMEYFCIKGEVAATGSAVTLTYDAVTETFSPSASESQLTPSSSIEPVNYVGSVEYFIIGDLLISTGTGGIDQVISGMDASNIGAGIVVPYRTSLWVINSVLSASTDSDTSQIGLLCGRFSDTVLFEGSVLKGSRDVTAFDSSCGSGGFYGTWFIMNQTYWHDNNGSAAVRGRPQACNFAQSTDPMLPSSGISGTALFYGNVFVADERHNVAWGVWEVNQHRRVIFDSNDMNMMYGLRAEKAYIGFYTFTSVAYGCPWTLRIFNNDFIGSQMAINIPFNRTLDNSTGVTPYPYFMPTNVDINLNRITYDQNYGAAINFIYRYYYKWSGSQSTGSPPPTGQQIYGVESYDGLNGPMEAQLLENNEFTAVDFMQSGYY